MEIKKVKNGWEFDGILFKLKKDALAVKEESERNPDLPKSLKNRTTDRAFMIYDSDNHTSFGYFIAQYMIKTKAKRNLGELAEFFDVSRQSLKACINGEKIPSPEHAERIRKATKCTKQELYEALETNRQFLMARTLNTSIEKIRSYS